MRQFRRIGSPRATDKGNPDFIRVHVAGIARRDRNNWHPCRLVDDGTITSPTEGTQDLLHWKSSSTRHWFTAIRCWQRRLSFNFRRHQRKQSGSLAGPARKWRIWHFRSHEQLYAMVATERGMEMPVRPVAFKRGIQSPKLWLQCNGGGESGIGRSGQCLGFIW